MNFNLYEYAKEKIIIVAHRGSCGGNIPCNIIPAYQNALVQGADMIEIDVDMTSDGKLVIFHPGMEKSHLGVDVKIPETPWEEVRKFRYLNYDRDATQFGLNTFDEVFETFKNRCYINVDKFWSHPKEINDAIKRHGMQEQVVVKSALNDNVLTVLEEVAPKLQFIPIVKSSHPMHQKLLKSNINYIGAEVLFTDENEEVASKEFISLMHKDKKLVWVNAIIYNYKVQLAAGHSDDTAICGDPDFGWGWLAKQGYDIIQTDWPLMLNNYLKENNLL